ncbi:MAG: FliA/WhiG family RNA polymerase sigma factor [Acidimicrobiia bacterium]|nr:FliA/WhiG family RNA polymerase sigma factor [Acidimicrobiia bacterium]
MATMPSELSQLIEEHLPLVKHVVFQVAVRFPRHVDREELARAGALGLVEAASRYDESRGVPFNRFAAQRIRGAILDSVRAADWAPRSIRQLGREIEKAELRLGADLGRAPSSVETADEMGITTSELDRIRTRMHRSVVLALEHEVYGAGEDDLVLSDVIADTDDSTEPSVELENRELHTYLRDAIDLLPERHRLVTIGYFVENRTSQELARFLGVTESRISQIRSEALAMLKDGIEAQYQPAPAEPSTCKERKRAAYVADIATASSATDRIDITSVLELVGN